MYNRAWEQETVRINEKRRAGLIESILSDLALQLSPCMVVTFFPPPYNHVPTD